MREYQIDVLIELVHDISFEDNPQRINFLTRDTALCQQGIKKDSKQKRPKNIRALAVYDKAISQLADNANFEVIGREEESNRIREFLDNGVRSCGCSYPLHITGVPGIGKTVTVLKILCELKEKYGTVLIPILINVMGFRNEEKIYQSILDRIISQKLDSPIDFLTELFTQPNNLPSKYSSVINKIKVIIIDEMDQLLKINSRKILYNLLEWTNSSSSQIILVGISNTVDFYDRLEPKQQSRMGEETVVFKPYSYEELLEILKGKLEGSVGLFEDNVLELICKRNANISSDIRSLMSICTLSIQQAKKQYVQKSQQQRTQCLPLIPVSHRHLCKHFSPDIHIYVLRSLPLVQKLILVSLYRLSRSGDQHDVSQKFSNIQNNLCEKYKLKPMNFITLIRQLFALRDLAIISMEHRKKQKEGLIIGVWRVKIQVEIDKEQDVIAKEIADI